MKKILLTFVLLVGIAVGLFAQNLTYQAVVRDNNQQLVVNTAVTATVTISFSSGNPYQAEVNGSTNIHGLLSIEFGNESLKGRDWTGATIAVKVVNAATPSMVYVNDDARPVSAVPYALSVDGQSIQNYLTEHHYVDRTELDGRHYLTSDSAVITTMQGNITANATNITSLQSGLSAAIGKEKTDSTTLAGRIDALESASMNCDDVKDCIKDTLSSYTTTSDLNALLQQLEARLVSKIDSLAHIVDSLSNGGDTPTTFTCGTSKVKDVDNNEYNTVQIGNQCWMAQNLRTKVEGSEYPKNGDNHVTGEDTVIYGRLYTWTAVTKGASTTYPQNGTDTLVQGICPTGWHVPSNAEWDTLTNYVNSVADYRCGGTDNAIANALSSSTGWQSPSECAAGHSSATLNKTGFSAVPAGNCFTGSFNDFGSDAYFWSATQDDDSAAWYRLLSGNGSNVNSSLGIKDLGFSVRCLRDPEAPAAMSVTTDSANTVTENSAKLYGNVTDMGGKDNVFVGFKYGTSESALTSIAADESAMYGTGKFNYTITGLTPNTQYYFKAFAANGTDTVYGEVKNFKTTGSALFTCGTDKVKDVQDNEYNTVQIGNQCWMAQNLRTNVDGSVYPQNSGVTVTGEDTVTYGRLYTWNAVTKGASTNYPENPTDTIVHGICPTGWHVPSNAEWDTLTNYVNTEANGYRCNGDGTIANALSSSTGWQSPSECAAGHSSATLNKTGFSAVPAGYCFNGNFNDFGRYAYFWSATEFVDYYAWCRGLGSRGSIVGSRIDDTDRGFSVRCLRD